MAISRSRDGPTDSRDAVNSISLASFHFSSDKAGIFLENFFLPGALLGDLVRHKTVQGTCTGLDGESVPGAGQ